MSTGIMMPLELGGDSIKIAIGMISNGVSPDRGSLMAYIKANAADKERKKDIDTLLWDSAVMVLRIAVSIKERLGDDQGFSPTPTKAGLAKLVKAVEESTSFEGTIKPVEKHDPPEGQERIKDTDRLALSDVPPDTGVVSATFRVVPTDGRPEVTISLSAQQLHVLNLAVSGLVEWRCDNDGPLNATAIMHGLGVNRQVHAESEAEKREVAVKNSMAWMALKTIANIAEVAAAATNPEAAKKDTEGSLAVME